MLERETSILTGRNLPKCFFPLLMLLLPAASTITEGASLTAHDPINTRPTRVEVSHTPPHSLPLQSFTPLHATPLLQDTPPNGRRGNPQDDDDEGRDRASTTGSSSSYSHPPRPASSPSTFTSYSSSFSSSYSSPPPTHPSPLAGLHQSPYRYQSSTSMRLFQSSSSLRQPDPKAMSSYVMKEYLPSRKQYRVSSSHLSSLPFQGSPRSTSSSSSFSSSSLPKKSLLLPPPPPYPIPSLPPSSPPPLVPLWPDPPPPPPPSSPPPQPAISPSPSPSLPPPPPPVLSPDPRSSTTVSLDHFSPPEGRLRRAGLNLDIPGVRRKHSRIPEIPEEDPPQPLGFGSSGIVRVRSNNHFGRDKKRAFLLSYKLFSQERLRSSGYRMDEQNYPETRSNLDSVQKESLMPRKDSKNTSELHSDRINVTTTFETSPNYPLENWEDQLSENLPNRQSADEEEASEGDLESEFAGMQLREDSTVVMQGKEYREEEEEKEEEEEEEDEDEEGAFSRRLDKQDRGTFSSGRFISSYQLESGKDEREDAFTDATEDLSNLNEDYENDGNDDDNNDTMTTEMHHAVNLEKLEKELSKKDEESASDLLLAISILQHHMIPTLQKGEENGRAKSDNKTSDGTNSKDHSLTDGQKSSRRGHHNYNIEIFDAMSSSTSSEDEDGEGLPNLKDITEGKSNNTIIFQSVHEVPLLPEHQSCYRWFVLVLDGNCSVIKQRMTAFVTFLKAALSSKLSIDYNDVYVPSVFCDNTFMVNISLDTVKNPQAEIKLRLLAEANTTLLEISEEIFYLEKILTKRSEEEDQDMQPLVKKPDDVELVIYIAVGCMCVFILLSVVIVALIRVCRQEGDPLDIGKTIPHQHLPRAFDFPIRRPNVIYSHRFSQALTPDKCASSTAHRMENTPSATGRSGVGVMAVTGSGRGSVLRYDTQFAGELMVGDEEFYSMGSPSIDDPYNDRRALVPSRRRATKVPGEDVIMEEDIVEEEEEDLEEEDEDDDEVEEEEGDDEGAEEKMADVPQDGMHLVEEEEEEEEEDEEEEEEDEDNDDDVEQCHFHRSEAVKAESSSRVGKEGTDSTAHNSGTSTGSEGKTDTSTGNGENDSSSTGNGEKVESRGENTRVCPDNQTKSSGMTATGGEITTAATKSDNTSHTATGNTDETGSRTNDPSMSKTRRPKGDVNTGSRAMKAGSRAKGLLGSRIRSRRNLLPGNEVVFTGIDNPCYNR